jgi:hypothetical protein
MPTPFPKQRRSAKDDAQLVAITPRADARPSGCRSAMGDAQPGPSTPGDAQLSAAYSLAPLGM